MKQITHRPLTLDDLLRLTKDEKRWGQRRRVFFSPDDEQEIRGVQSLEKSLLKWKEAIEWRDKNKPRLKARLQEMYRILDSRKLSTENLDN